MSISASNRFAILNGFRLSASRHQEARVVVKHLLGETGFGLALNLHMEYGCWSTARLNLVYLQSHLWDVVDPVVGRANVVNDLGC